MGVFGRLASIFGKGSATGSVGGAGLAPDEPIIVKWPPEPGQTAGEARGGSDAPETNGAPGEHGPDTIGFAETPATQGRANSGVVTRPTSPDDILPAPSKNPSRQELIEELRHNYKEVIELVRKVNTHLDDQASRIQRQEERSDRLAEIAEKLSTALDELPRLREQNERLVDLSGQTVAALQQLAEATRDGHAAVGDAIAEQARAARESAERAEQLLAQSVQTQDASVKSVGDLSRALGDSSDRMNGLLGEIQRGAGEREARMAEMIARSQRWFIIAMVLCLGAVLLIALAAAMFLR